MVIEIKVDLSNFYAENEHESFEKQIKDYIVHEVKNVIIAEVKKDMLAEFTTQVKEIIEAEKQEIISTQIKLMASEMQLKTRGAEKISVVDHIRHELESVHLSPGRVTQYLDSQISKTTETIYKELKNRYDVSFASQIITKLNANKMLKDDVARNMLGENTEG